MTSTFAAYVTNTAFSLQLSRPQLCELSKVAKTLRGRHPNYKPFWAWCEGSVIWQLKRKGLVEQVAGHANHWALTKEGRILAHLLSVADLLVLDDAQLASVRGEQSHDEYLDDLAREQGYTETKVA
jgi:hypothetical protein